jgi:hypothetical protein
MAQRLIALKDMSLRLKIPIGHQVVVATAKCATKFAIPGGGEKEGNMKCPFCNHILEDSWLKRVGASLMGRSSGEAKARSRDQASAASRVRWDEERKKKKSSTVEQQQSREQDFTKLRTLAGIAQPKRKRKR